MAVEIQLTDGKIFLENVGDIKIKTAGPTLQDLQEVQFTNVRRRRENSEGVLQEDRALVEIESNAVITASEMLSILNPEELATTELVFKKLFDNCQTIADARSKVVDEINASGGSVV